MFTDDNVVDWQRAGVFYFTFDPDGDATHCTYRPQNWCVEVDPKYGITDKWQVDFNFSIEEAVVCLDLLSLPCHKFWAGDGIVSKVVKAAGAAGTRIMNKKAADAKVKIATYDAVGSAGTITADVVSFTTPAKNKQADNAQKAREQAKEKTENAKVRRRFSVKGRDVRAAPPQRG